MVEIQICCATKRYKGLWKGGGRFYINSLLYISSEMYGSSYFNTFSTFLKRLWTKYDQNFHLGTVWNDLYEFLCWKQRNNWYTKMWVEYKTTEAVICLTPIGIKVPGSVSFYLLTLGLQKFVCMIFKHPVWRGKNFRTVAQLFLIAVRNGLIKGISITWMKLNFFADYFVQQIWHSRSPKF